MVVTLPSVNSFLAQKGRSQGNTGQPIRPAARERKTKTTKKKIMEKDKNVMYTKILSKYLKTIYLRKIISNGVNDQMNFFFFFYDLI